MSNNEEPKLPKAIEKKLQARKKDMLAAKASELGIDPFEILLHLAAGNARELQMFRTDREGNILTREDGTEVTVNISPVVRLGAASEACSYIHPKLKSIEHSMDEDQFNERGQQILNNVLDMVAKNLHPNAPDGMAPEPKPDAAPKSDMPPAEEGNK